MRVLIAEDDPVARRVLEASLTHWGYEVVVTCNGAEALKALQGEDAPPLAVLDWMMPEVDGVEVCRELRRAPTSTPLYIILLTSRGSSENIVTGLNAGANDYLTKPIKQEELRARVGVGVRVVELQTKLAVRVRELQKALVREKQLQGLLPICSYCKRIRDDKDYWQQVEAYISEHAGVQFSHGICPDCYEKVRQTELRGAEQGGPKGD